MPSLPDWQRYGYESYESFISSKAGASLPDDTGLMGAAHEGRYEDGEFVAGAMLAYRGLVGCQNATCTRRSDMPETCFGWHCPHCHEPCSSQGHKCPDPAASCGSTRNEPA